MSRNSSMCWAILATSTLLVSGCGRSKKPIVVGAKDAGQSVLAEIVAQHLEHRTGHKVRRVLNLGSTAGAYQSFLSGEVNIYPEESGTLQVSILKEAPSVDAATTFERVRSEMRRTVQADLLDPIGTENGWAIIVPKDDALRLHIETLSSAVFVKPGWRLGVTPEFNQRKDGLAALQQYRLPMIAMTYVGDAASLYDRFQNRQITMVAGNMSDGWLARHENWKVLTDDRKLFPFFQTCLLARMDLLSTDPKIRPALAELSGRISTSEMQKMNAELTMDHKQASEVAEEFLSRAGLK